MTTTSRVEVRNESLVRAIGTFGLAAGIINITIGGGIFRLPANVAGSLGPAPDAGEAAAMLFLLMTAKLYGGSQDAIDRAFVEIKKLLPFTQADWSGTLSTMLTRGDVTVAVIDFPEIVALQKKGVPVEMVVPTEGVLAFEQSFNVLKNAPAKEEAYKYLDFILRPDVQETMAREFFTSPTNVRSRLSPELAKDVPVSGERMKSIFQFDWAKVNPQVAAITDRWNREMK